MQFTQNACRGRRELTSPGDEPQSALASPPRGLGRVAAGPPWKPAFMEDPKASSLGRAEAGIKSLLPEAGSQGRELSGDASLPEGMAALGCSSPADGRGLQ